MRTMTTPNINCRLLLIIVRLLDPVIVGAFVYVSMKDLPYQQS